MTGKQLYEKYRSNLQVRKMIVKCWDDLSYVERATWDSTAHDVAEHYLIVQACKITEEAS